MPEVLQKFQQSVKSIKEKIFHSYEAYEQLIRSGFSSNSTYDEQSSELTQEQNEFLKYFNSEMRPIFVVHSDFLSLCKLVKRTKLKATALEKTLEANNRQEEFSKNSTLLSSIISTLEVSLESIKKQAETK